MKALFITFEGTEGGGKSTQILLLAERLQALGQSVRVLREPGGTPIGEEIRHTLMHSDGNAAMTAEAELLLMNASRAQLVREVIRPTLEAGQIVLCDRFYDSTTAYQGYGRRLDLLKVREIVDFAVGDTRPDLTLLLHVPLEMSEARRQSRRVQLRTPPVVSADPAGRPSEQAPRDRLEENDRAFFERVAEGFAAIAAAEPRRVRWVDATRRVEEVQASVWAAVEPLL
jgi:dTMP kinase